ncbi:ADP-L-glycero-D-manno-heptose-6-epimerase [Aspergillus terreus]|nr:ADP-L-glycero-D-manno-heptose-6-epimerase [Aspergillus terreus]
MRHTQNCGWELTIYSAPSTFKPARLFAKSLKKTRVSFLSPSAIAIGSGYPSSSRYYPSGKPSVFKHIQTRHLLKSFMRATQLRIQDARDLSEEEGALKRAWEALLRASPIQIASCTKELMTLLQHDDQETAPELRGLAKLITRLHQQWPNDIGLFAVFFMNHVTLTPGEALFVQPNELHAYLSGDAVECMASSANVVRGGLTKKKKDIETLVSMLSYSYHPPTTPKICPLNPYVLSAKETAFSVLYESPAEEFDIVKTGLSSPDAEVHFGPIQGPSMMICLQGGGEIAAGCREDKIETGSIWFISAGNIVSLKNRKPGNLTVFQALCDSQGTGKEVAAV